jgi:hypothetical protein
VLLVFNKRGFDKKGYLNTRKNLWIVPIRALLPPTQALREYNSSPCQAAQLLRSLLAKHVAPSPRIEPEAKLAASRVISTPTLFRFWNGFTSCQTNVAGEISGWKPFTRTACSTLAQAKSSHFSVLAHRSFPARRSSMPSYGLATMVGRIQPTNLLNWLASFSLQRLAGLR